MRAYDALLFFGLAFAALSCAPAQPPAQQDDLPDAQGLINKYVDALGGAKALQELQTYKVTGTMEFSGYSEVARFEQYFGKDNYYYRVAYPGDEVYEEGRNGDIAWEKDPARGNRKFEGEELKDFIRRTNPLDMLTWNEDYPGKITTQAKDVSINGVNCYEVKFEPNNGYPARRFFSAETGLVVKVIRIWESSEGPITVELYFDDYQAAGANGAKMPMKRTRVLEDGNKLNVTKKEVVALDAFPADKAAVPPEFDR